MKSLFARLALPMSLLTLGLGFAEPALSQGVAQKTAKDDFSLDLPGPEQLFRIQSEDNARKEIREAAFKKGVKNVAFPLDAQPLAKADYLTQTMPAQVLTVPLGHVCHRILYFQDIRTERYGQSCGLAEPLRSAFLFYGKTLILPGMFLAVPPCQYQCWHYPFVTTSGP